MSTYLWSIWSNMLSLGFYSFISNRPRSSSVKIDSPSSPSTSILTGVPQGSILGLLLQTSSWNALPNHLSSIPSLPTFRRALKHHLFLLAHPDSSASVRSNQLNVSHFVIQRQVLPSHRQPGNIYHAAQLKAFHLSAYD